QLYEQALIWGEQAFEGKEASALYTFHRASLIQKETKYTNPATGESSDGKNNSIALEMCNRAIEAFPESYGAVNCAELVKQIVDPEVDFSLESVVLPDKPILLTLKLRNIAKVQVRLYKLPTFSDDLSNYRNLDIWWWQQENRLQNLLKTKAFFETSYPGHNENDYAVHAFDVVLKGQPVGKYVLVASDDFSLDLESQHLKLSVFTSSNLTVITPSNKNPVLHVYNRTTGKAVAKAKITAYLRKEGKCTEAWAVYTDKTGKAILPKSKNEWYEYFEVSLGADCLGMDQISYYGFVGEMFSRNHTNTLALLFTDRSIYRPGQTIYCKGIIYEADQEQYHKLLTNTQLSLTLKDTNYQTIATQQLVTNEFGGVDCTFTAPMGVLTGQMTILAEKESGQFGSVSLRVEEYKRPKFEVTIAKPAETYKLEKDVTVTGKALAYAGFPIDGAKVAYTIKRTPKFSTWRWWWGNPSPVGGQMLSSGNLTTDQNGGFSITFTAEKDENYNRYEGCYFSYEINATVTDINGETHSGLLNLSIGTGELIIEPVIDYYVPKSANPLAIKLRTTNLGGEKIATKGTVTISRLQTPDHIQKRRIVNQRSFNDNFNLPTDRYYLSRDEFLKNFPTDTYANDDHEDTWKVAKQMYSGEFNTGQNDIVSIAGFKKWKTGMYRIEAVTTYKGEDIKVTQYFTVYALKDKRMPYIMADMLIPIKTDCQPGETAQILLGSSYKNVNVSFKVEKQHKIVDSLNVVLSKEQRLFSFPVLESDLGGFYVHISFWRDNRFYSYSQEIEVPWINKQLDFEYTTFRDKLLPGQTEQWQLKLKDNTGGAASAELLASMYDASLDAINPHKWSYDIYHKTNMSYSWRVLTDTYTSNGSGFRYRYQPNFPWLQFSQLNDFGKHITWDNVRGRYTGQLMCATSCGPGGSSGSGFGGNSSNSGQPRKSSFSPSSEAILPQPEQPDLSEVTVRKNQQETAFFYPSLHTDEQGEVTISFTVPEALTRWKFQALAITWDLQIGLTENSTVTQKPLMVTPNLPRFFREGDKITVSAKISALGETEQTGQCRLYLIDPLTNLPVESQFKLSTAPLTFTVKPGESTVVEWKLEIPFGISTVSCKVVAQADKFSDGEENTLPILSNRMLVTESLPLPVRGKSSKSFTFDKLLKAENSNTLKHHRLSLEYTSNPAWYAVQALPYMMEYPYDCNEQVFTGYYANSLASHIANANPRIQKVFEAWKNTPDAAALMSNLEKNPELKSVILQETPWVLDAQNEAQSKQRIGVLFDLDKLKDQQQVTFNRLKQNQNGSGAWSWFPGMPDSWWVTQYIMEGMGHLIHLGVLNDVKFSPRDYEEQPMDEEPYFYNSEIPDTTAVISPEENYEGVDDQFNSAPADSAIAYSSEEQFTDVAELTNPHNLGFVIDEQVLIKAIAYLDRKILEDYNNIQKNSKPKEDHLGYIEMHYLYTRSFFPEIKTSAKVQKAVNYFRDQAAKYWGSKGLYGQAMLALAEFRYGNKKLPGEIIKSFNERAFHNEELGMYWKENASGWYWHQAPIETQALLIEAYGDISNDTASVNGMKTWLLQQKQTTNWKTSKATAEACYALLLSGTEWLNTDKPVEITLGGETIDTSKLRGTTPEAGTGYFKTSWSGSEISAKQANIRVTNPNPGPVWGALCWQYFEDLDKITPAETPLKLKKQLFVERVTDKGTVIEPISDKAILKVGDKVIVRIELRTDRDMEYVHLKDMQSAVFEPINVLSSYKWQDGLGYYEATGDAATNFFIEYLLKGTYVFEYPLRVSNKGDFSNGITSIQSMYAPEFSAHSEGTRVEVKQ
ncbi:MAG: alpha-2-macroglobulin family protein, partial [Candidatus Cloacimonetes bacterium]|nr:alpha-2-macroglobulin family protein [Candidatus Cloacimonadota bacterium]